MVTCIYSMMRKKSGICFLKMSTPKVSRQQTDQSLEMMTMNNVRIKAMGNRALENIICLPMPLDLKLYRSRHSGRSKLHSRSLQRNDSETMKQI